MKRFTLMIMLALTVLAFSPIAHSASAFMADDTHGADTSHGDDHATSDPTVIAEPKAGIIPAVTAIVIFIIVLAILSTMVWPKITAGLDERNEKIVGEIAAAEQARKQAREALDEYEKNLAEARAESQKMIEDTRAQQSQLAAQLKATADTELSAMREKALSEIEGAKKQALGELYNESVNLASVMAGKILQRQVTAEDQQRLMEESIEEMKSVS